MKTVPFPLSTVAVGVGGPVELEIGVASPLESEAVVLGATEVSVGLCVSVLVVESVLLSIVGSPNCLRSGVNVWEAATCRIRTKHSRAQRLLQRRAILPSRCPDQLWV